MKVQDSADTTTRARGPGVTSTDPDPLFSEAIKKLRWLMEEARNRCLDSARTASLATADAVCRPSVRTVTVAEINASGPMFFVDSRSGKGQQLITNPQAALCFFWPGLRYQVGVDGKVVPVEAARTDRLWARRGRDQQLVAWIHEMGSSVAEDSGVGERKARIRHAFALRRVARPESWRCFVLRPEALRFWLVRWREPRALEEYRQYRDGIWRKHLWPPL